jgi:hypothetical protein
VAILMLSKKRRSEQTFAMATKDDGAILTEIPGFRQISGPAPGSPGGRDRRAARNIRQNTNLTFNLWVAAFSVDSCDFMDRSFCRGKVDDPRNHTNKHEQNKKRKFEFGTDSSRPG